MFKESLFCFFFCKARGHESILDPYFSTLKYPMKGMRCIAPYFGQRRAQDGHILRRGRLRKIKCDKELRGQLNNTERQDY